MKKIITIGLMSLLLVGCNMDLSSESKGLSKDEYVIELENSVNQVALGDKTITSDMDAKDVKDIISDYMKLTDIFNVKMNYNLFDGSIKAQADMFSSYVYDEASKNSWSYLQINSKNLKNNKESTIKSSGVYIWCESHYTIHYNVAENFYLQNELYIASSQTYDEENSQLLTYCLPDKPIQILNDDVNKEDYMAASNASKILNRNPVESLFYEYSGYEQHYKYSFQLFENYIVLTNENPFGFSMIGHPDHVKAILLNSLSNNYSMKTNIYLNLNTLEIEKWNYSFKGLLTV